MTAQDYKTALEFADAEYEAKCAPIDAAYLALRTPIIKGEYGTIDEAYWADHGQATRSYEARIAALSATYNKVFL